MPTGVETTLAQVRSCWQQVSTGPGRSPAADDNLFGEGVDSFVFIRFVRLVAMRFELELPLAEIFESPTLRTVAECVDRAGSPPP